MAFGDISGRAAVLAAVEEYEEVRPESYTGRSAELMF